MTKIRRIIENNTEEDAISLLNTLKHDKTLKHIFSFPYCETAVEFHEEEAINAYSVKVNIDEGHCFELFDIGDIYVGKFTKVVESREEELILSKKLKTFLSYQELRDWVIKTVKESHVNIQKLKEINWKNTH